MNNTKIQQVTNNSGTTFTVRIVRQGDNYGRNFCLTHDEAEPLVEVYDTRYPHTVYGQFVSRYYAKDLLRGFIKEQPHGITLDGGFDGWIIDAGPWGKICEWVDAKVGAASTTA